MAPKLNQFDEALLEVRLALVGVGVRELPDGSGEEADGGWGETAEVEGRDVSDGGRFSSRTYVLGPDTVSYDGGASVGN